MMLKLSNPEITIQDIFYYQVEEKSEFEFGKILDPKG